MNSRGHAQSLVVAHPGNTNAVKAGVYSTRLLAPRVRELEEELATTPSAELLQHVLKRELAALMALGEAMDRALAEDGLRGRTGEPRTLISQRLRLSEKLRRTAEALVATSEAGTAITVEAAEADGEIESADYDPRDYDLLSRIPDDQNCASMDEVLPQTFDPDAFLRSVIIATNPATDARVLLRARRLLTTRKKSRPPDCLCFSGNEARDAVEFYEWVEDLREEGLTAFGSDPTLADFVRRLARGEMPEPWFARRRTYEAFQKIISDALARARGEQTEEPPNARENDPTIAPFWKLLLSADKTLPVAQRLDAFVALDAAGALRQCTCQPSTAQLEQEVRDEGRAYIFRILIRRSVAAATHRLCYPETFLALQDAIDTAVHNQRAAALRAKYGEMVPTW